MVKIRTTHSRWESDLFDTFTELPAFRQVFEVVEAGALLIDFKCEVKHRDIVNGAIVAGGRIKYRTAATEAGLAVAPLKDIEGAVSGGNIIDITDHYHSICIPSALALVPGWYRIEVHMYSGSTTPHASGTCARLSNQTNPANEFGCYNILRTIEIPGGSVGVSIPA